MRLYEYFLIYRGAAIYNYYSSLYNITCKYVYIGIINHAEEEASLPIASMDITNVIYLYFLNCNKFSRISNYKYIHKSLINLQQLTPLRFAAIVVQYINVNAKCIILVKIAHAADILGEKAHIAAATLVKRAKHSSRRAATVRLFSRGCRVTRAVASASLAPAHTETDTHANSTVLKFGLEKQKHRISLK